MKRATHNGKHNGEAGATQEQEVAPRESFWRRRRFPHFRQLDKHDCGPTCLRMIAAHYGRTFTARDVRQRASIHRTGASFQGLTEAAESLGFRAFAARVPFERLLDVPLPCVIPWGQAHFVVLYRIRGSRYWIADPAHRRSSVPREAFLKAWARADREEGAKGLVLALEPTPDFHRGEATDETGSGWGFLFTYLRKYRAFLFQLLLGLGVGTLLSLVAPFLTQAIVDVGVQGENIGFVYTILLAQLMVFCGKTSVEFIRSWVLLHIGVRLNLTMLSDLLAKLMRLPMPFFESRILGDLLQRVQDQARIEQFLTSTTLNILFSLVNVLVYGIVLCFYSIPIFLLFVAGSAVSFSWVLIFMRRRRALDNARFSEVADEQSNMIELLTGMPEIKLNQAERRKRWQWEAIQARRFRTRAKGLAVGQMQQGGAATVNELKNILITFLSAKAVIDGDLSLGMMMALQQIVGQLNAPLLQFLDFAQTYQDARISLERLSELHEHPDEERSTGRLQARTLPHDKSIEIQNLSFRYQGADRESVLTDLSLRIPEGKVTAIVGPSGSGKTTLLKLLLMFHPPTRGEIRLGALRLSNVSPEVWRSRCGVVLQDGYLFTESVAQNIALGTEEIDSERLLHAARMANIHDTIEAMPLGYETKVGPDGSGLSQGQRQRILIARAIYKDPQYVFFDEATSALDANNERIIMQNLDRFFDGRTVLVIAHRLSTVRKADQILVLDEGRMVECGDHQSLTRSRGSYYRLIKNQLELGT